MKNVIQSAVDYTMSIGAEACDVIVTTSDSINFSAQDGKLEKYKVAKTSVLGIRVIKNKKIGLAYSESFDEDAIQFAAKSALANSEYSGVNEHETICVKNENDFIKHAPFNDKSSLEEKIEFALKLESEVKKRDPRFQAAPYNGLTVGEMKSYYLNSLGTYTEESEGNISAYTSALLKEGERTSMHYSSMLAHELSQLDLETSIQEVLEHSANWLNAQSIPTGKYDVIFQIDVLAQLIDSYSSYFSAKAAIEKRNPWEAKLNQTVAAKNFTLIDVPAYKDAFSKQYVDSEGMLKKDLTLIENGVLKSFYHNTSTASFFKTTSTGHASRGARTALGVAGTNWLIKPGADSELEVKAGTYLEIIYVMGLGRGDTMSGEFSFGASGYLCKDGKRIQPVKGITIAGNFNKILNGIAKMGTDLEPNSSYSRFAPMMRFCDLSVAGV